MKLNVPDGWEKKTKESPSFYLIDLNPKKIKWIRSVRIAIRKVKPDASLSASDLLAARYRKHKKMAENEAVEVEFEKMKLAEGIYYYYFYELVAMPNIHSVYGVFKSPEGGEYHVDVHQEDLGEILKDTFDEDFKHLVKHLFTF